jgi:DNA invertase Pin-like site-specific DNA recombinase
MKTGYARVSTKEQTVDLQVDALKKAGCTTIAVEQGRCVSASVPKKMSTAERLPYMRQISEN